MLGSGFSKAIGDAMPTLDELGHRIAKPFMAKPSFELLPPAARTAMASGHLPGGNLEAWLSNLATPAPFLDAVERLHNSAIALELVRLIVDDIERSEATVLGSPMPYWLGRLVSLWDRLQANVITFNFDTLVEQAVNACEMPWISIPAGSLAFAEGVAVPLQKMHGSLNWWWIPGDRLGTTVQPQPLAGRWRQPERPLPIPGMERFVIPPLAMKSEYYDLTFTRDVWQLSREALEGASRVVLMGYSAPVTDLTTASLLSNYMNPDVPCVVVDVAPDDIVRRLGGLGLRSVEPFGGAEPIRRFTEQYEREASRDVSRALLPLLDAPDVTMQTRVMARVAGSGDAPQLFVTEVQVDDDATAIVAKPLPSGEATFQTKKVAEVRPAIEDAARSRRRLVLRIPDEPDRAVLNIARRMFFELWLAIEA